MLPALGAAAVLARYHMIHAYNLDSPPVRPLELRLLQRFQQASTRESLAQVMRPVQTCSSIFHTHGRQPRVGRYKTRPAIAYRPDIDFQNIPFDVLDTTQWCRFKVLLLGLMITLTRHDIEIIEPLSLVELVNIPTSYRKVVDYFKKTGVVGGSDRYWGPFGEPEITWAERFWYCHFIKRGLLTVRSKVNQPFVYDIQKGRMLRMLDML